MSYVSVATSPAMCTIDDVPEELLEEILEHLADLLREEEKSSYGMSILMNGLASDSVALVCRRWRGPAQRMLFREVKFKDPKRHRWRMELIVAQIPGDGPQSDNEGVDPPSFAYTPSEERRQPPLPRAAHNGRRRREATSCSVFRKYVFGVFLQYDMSTD